MEFGELVVLWVQSRSQTVCQNQRNSASVLVVGSALKFRLFGDPRKQPSAAKCSPVPMELCDGVYARAPLGEGQTAHHRSHADCLGRNFLLCGSKTRKTARGCFSFLLELRGRTSPLKRGSSCARAPFHSAGVFRLPAFLAGCRPRAIAWISVVQGRVLIS